MYQRLSVSILFRNIAGIEELLYAKGMPTRDIGEQLQELYGIELSAEMVSRITDRLAPEIKEWQQRPLEAVYSILFFEAIHYKIKEEGWSLNRASYDVAGVIM